MGGTSTIYVWFQTVYMLMMTMFEISKNVRIWKRETKSLANEVMCVAADTKYKKRYEYLHEGTMCIGIDTLSTYCLTNDMTDFDSDTIKPVHHHVTGIAGKNSSSISYEGAGKFKIMDDDGQVRTIPLPELYYCSTVPYKIISPQHIDQCWRKSKIGTFSTSTDGNGTMLVWTDQNKKRYVKTVPHCDKSNIPVCRSSPSYGKYRKYLENNP
jgi:hypothetical protein